MEFPELLRNNKVTMLIYKELNVLLSDATLSDVISSMNTREVSYCVIIDKETKKLMGIITESDILVLAEKGIYDKNLNVMEFCKNTDFIQVKSNKSIASVVKRMYRTGFKNVIITNENDENKVEGVVGVRDFVSHLIEYFPETVYNVNLSPTTEDREGA